MCQKLDDEGVGVYWGMGVYMNEYGTPSASPRYNGIVTSQEIHLFLVWETNLLLRSPSISCSKNKSGSQSLFLLEVNFHSLHLRE